MNSLLRTGVPLVLSAPSGAGKTTMCRRLMTVMDGLSFSISSTTRAPRPQEKDGIDYDFINEATFTDLIEQEAFLEWAHVHGQRYGTRRSRVEQALTQGIDVLFDIDVQGARQLQEAMPEAVLVFVLPPSLDELATRLRGRKADSDAEIARRLKGAQQEIEAAGFYTYFIVNDDIDRAVADLAAIVRSERLRRVDKAAFLREVIFAKSHA